MNLDYKWTRGFDPPTALFLILCIAHILHDIEIGAVIMNVLIVFSPYFSKELSIQRELKIPFLMCFGLITSLDRYGEIIRFYFPLKTFVLFFVFGQKYQFVDCLQGIFQVIKRWSKQDAKEQTYSTIHSTPHSNFLFSTIPDAYETRECMRMQAYDQSESQVEGSNTLETLGVALNETPDAELSLPSTTFKSTSTRTCAQFAQNTYNPEYLAEIINSVENEENLPIIDDFPGPQFKFSDTLIGLIVFYCDNSGLNGSQIAYALNMSYTNGLDRKNLKKGAAIYGILNKVMQMDLESVIRGIIYAESVQMSSKASDSCRGQREIENEFGIPEKVTYRNSKQDINDNNKKNDDRGRQKTSIVSKIFGKKVESPCEAFVSRYYHVEVVTQEIMPETRKILHDLERPQRPYASHVTALKSNMKKKGKLNKVYHLIPN